MVWVFSIAAFSLLIGLGIWQLKRLEWKEGLIHEIEAARSETPPEGLPATEKLAEFPFRHFRVKGHFEHEKEFHLAARYYKNQLGYHILTPFALSDGREILLNRGWVPVEKKETESRPESIAADQGEEEITIRLRTDSDHNFFTPEADPVHNLWFWKDISKMNIARGLSLLPYTADVIAPQGEALPIPLEDKIELRNDHLGYAITWFLVALGGVVIFLTYHYEPKAKK